MKKYLSFLIVLILTGCSKNNIHNQRLNIKKWLNRNFIIDAIYVNGTKRQGYYMLRNIKYAKFEYQIASSPNLSYYLPGSILYYITPTPTPYPDAYFIVSDKLDKMYIYKRDSSYKAESTLPGFISKSNLPNPYSTQNIKLSEIWTISEFTDKKLTIHSYINDSLYEAHFKY